MLQCVTAISVLALNACGLRASDYPDFSHSPAFRLEGVRMPLGGGAPQKVVIYRDGPKFRIETLLPGGRTIVVFDPATNDAYALTPQTSSLVRAASNAPRVLGTAVRVSDAAAPQPLETPWALLMPAGVSKIGPCRMANQSGDEWRATDTALGVAQRTACITPDGIVLQEREQNKTIFAATRLDRGPQAASLFGVPPDYQRSSPGAAAPETTAAAAAIAANAGPAG